MDRLSFLLLTLAERLFRPKHNVRLQILEAQIRFLRLRIEASRIVPSPEEKHELLRLGALLDHDVGDVMHIVLPETYRTWLRKKARRGIFKRSGRPGIDVAVLRVKPRRQKACFRRARRRHTRKQGSDQCENGPGLSLP